MQAANPSMRTQVLSVYKSMIRTARALPSHNHRGVALLRVRSDFRSCASLAPGSTEASEALQLAHTQLENLESQLSHMRSIMQQNTLTHDAPKPSRMYQAVAAAAAPGGRGSGSRAFHSSRQVRAEDAPSGPTASAAVEGPRAPVAVPTPAWMKAPGGAVLGQAPAAAVAANDAATAASAAASTPTIPIMPVPATAAGGSGLGPPGTALLATHIVHVRLTPNNTICTLTAMNGQVVAWTSSGSVGFKNAKKSTNMACIACGEQLGLKARQANIRAVDMHIAGFHKNKRAVLKGVIKSGLNIVTIKDVTPIPFNGCKPRKVRRL